MTLESAGFRFYVLRRNPWRDTDRIDTLAGSLYKPADYAGDYLMVWPPETTRDGRRYYLVYDALIPGNLASLGYDEVSHLTALYHAGYRRIPFDRLPPAWQRAVAAEAATMTPVA